MSVVSMDDSDLSRRNGLLLDSVPHPKDRLGEKAAENMVHLIHNRNFDATYEFIENVIQRGSVVSNPQNHS
jgi:GntR family transcriptional regulator of arabinose operon